MIKFNHNLLYKSMRSHDGFNEVLSIDEQALKSLNKKELAVIVRNFDNNNQVFTDWFLSIVYCFVNACKSCSL